MALWLKIKAIFARISGVKMQICFLTAVNPHDKRSWSGIYFSMYSNLEKHHDLEWIGALRLKFWQRVITKLQREYTDRVLRKNRTAHSRLRCKFYAEAIEEKLSKRNYDIIFAPAASALVAYLETDTP